jgi:hypothetical protein
MPICSCTYFARAAAARRTVGVERLDLVAHDRGFLARLGAAGDAQSHFVRTFAGSNARPCSDVLPTRSMRKPEKRPSQPLAHDLRGELRACERVGARVADLAFPDITREIADARLELRGCARPRAPRTSMRSFVVSASVTCEKSAVTSGVR